MDLSQTNYIKDRIGTFEIERPEYEDRDYEAAVRREAELLRYLKEDGKMHLLVYRLMLLSFLGWKQADLAAVFNVSRVTINAWIRRYGGANPVENRLEETARSEIEIASDFPLVMSRLNQQQALNVLDLKFTHDKFIVPEGFEEPFKALWRVAYRARGATATLDQKVIDAADALDILISLMIRRGVTSLAIGKAAGVTHRAVLERMNRARARGLLLDCDMPGGGCETFYGEKELLGAFRPAGTMISGTTPSIVQDNWLNVDDATDHSQRAVAFVKITAGRPSTFWVQTLRSALTDAPYLTGMSRTMAQDNIVRMLLGRVGPDALATAASPREYQLTLMIGRLNPANTVAQYIASSMIRNQMVAVPAPLLYTASIAAQGLHPKTPEEAALHIPKNLWTKYFASNDLVLDCFRFSESIMLDWKPIVKHNEKETESA